MDDFSELEKKVYEALFDNKQNEVYNSVKELEKSLSSSWTSSIDLPDSNEILGIFKQKQQQKIIKMNWTRNMNKKIIYILGMAALVLIGLFLVLNTGDKPKEQVASNDHKAKVTFVMGDVRLKSNSTDEGVKPELGALVSASQILKTGDKSTVDLEFANGSSLRVKANTEIVVKRLLENNGKVVEEVSLKKGMLVAHVTKKKQNDDFNIVTPTVIAGVRGTSFLVEVNPNATKEDVTRVSVLDGNVGITRHKNETPLTVEPFEVLDGRESAQEVTAGGIFKKTSIPSSDVKIIEGKEDEGEAETSSVVTEQSLFKKYGRLEILTLEGGKKVTGVITTMDDSTVTIQTVKGLVKVDRKKVISQDQKPLK